MSNTNEYDKDLFDWLVEALVERGFPQEQAVEAAKSIGQGGQPIADGGRLAMEYECYHLTHKELELAYIGLRTQEMIFHRHGEMVKSDNCGDCADTFEEIMRKWPDGVDVYQHKEINITCG